MTRLYNRIRDHLALSFQTRSLSTEKNWWLCALLSIGLSKLLSSSSSSATHDHSLSSSASTLAQLLTRPLHFLSSTLECLRSSKLQAFGAQQASKRGKKTMTKFSRPVYTSQINIEDYKPANNLSGTFP